MLISADELDISRIKVIIWDLDNTFWDGTISEGEVKSVVRHIELIRSLSEHGIVNSICSKNDYNVCRDMLVKMGVWDYFVFPSIDWTPKTGRVVQIISDMNLRAANALFLDDEPANLQRVLGTDSMIMCGTIQELADPLINQMSRMKKDASLSRLKQYHELEQRMEARTHFSSDEDFLKNAGIMVHLEYQTHEKAERIYELINRTNQLNYTKKRLDKNEVDILLNDPEKKCAYISCKDNYCDYGIVGFLALNKKENKLEHYLFSCRTIGMGIEQFIYAYLGFPLLTVMGDVVTSLNDTDCPDWINVVEDLDNKTCPVMSSDRILVKGPCDVSQIIPFFTDENMFETEFAYISQEKKGMYVESFNHSSQIIASLRLSENEKRKMIETVPFIDTEYYQTSIFKVKYDYIIFSLLSDYSLGLYRNKSKPEIIVPFAQFTRDCTKEENWNYAVSVFMQDGKTNLELEKQYISFKNNFEFIGQISDELMLENLQTIRDNIDNHTMLIFLNGAEIPFIRECKPGYENREYVHAHFNRILEDFASRNHNCHIINVNDYFADGEDPYLDTINHYKKVIYYRIALGIQKYINENSNNKMILIRDKEVQNSSKKSFVRRIAARAYHMIKRHPVNSKTI